MERVYTPAEQEREIAVGFEPSFLRTLFMRQETAILIPFVLITLFFYWRNPAMLSPLSISTTLRTMAFPGLIGMGMVLLMISGEIDLSTGAVISLTAVFAAWLMKTMALPVSLCVFLALVLALLVGLGNAWLTVRVGLNSIIATMGMQFIARGVSYSFTSGVPIYPLPESVAILGNLRPLGLSFTFFLMLALVVIIQLVLNQTRWGAMIYATGGNRMAAEMCGINTGRVKTICFMLTSLFAGIAGLLTMSQMPIPSGDPIFGRNIELDIIVGVVVGGVSLFGGRGSAIGTLFGVLLMQVVRSGLVIAGFDAYWQIPALGALLMAAASVDVIRNRSRER